ncbi:MAG: hypothetical protein WCC17_17425 [Candidatus Nitrosopolaris sp.]
MAAVSLGEIFLLSLIPLAAGIGADFLKNYPTYASVANNSGDFLWGLLKFVLVQYFGTVGATVAVANRLAKRTEEAVGE